MQIINRNMSLDKLPLALDHLSPEVAPLVPRKMTKSQSSTPPTPRFSKFAPLSGTEDAARNNS